MWRSDLDPTAARGRGRGDTVVFADSVKREALIAAGISRAAAVVVTFADCCRGARAFPTSMPSTRSGAVVVRARVTADIERFTAAGANEWCRRLSNRASWCFAHAGACRRPLSRVMRRVALVRGSSTAVAWTLHGASDDEATAGCASGCTQ